MKSQRNLFTAVIDREGKWYVAYCPEVGTASQGRTIDQAIVNLLMLTHGIKRGTR